MIRSTLIAIGLLPALAVDAASATQMIVLLPCTPTRDFETAIGEKHGERPVAAGINSYGSNVVLFVNPETSTFTITMRLENGLTCVVSGGKDWFSTSPKGGPERRGTGL